MSPIAIAAYLTLFALAAGSFLFINLLVGKFIRPSLPNQEKLEVYECGEPTIGSSFVQFDLRFYVVALLFLIFDVEVAFFFPWATVYGKSTQLMDPAVAKVAADGTTTLETINIYRELGLPAATAQGVSATEIESSARQMALLSLGDILVFFAVLLVGFAYVWYRGDLDWVRAVSQERRRRATPTLPASEKTEEPVLV